MLLTIRKMEEGDRPFIYGTMLRGLYHGCDLYNEIEPNAFYDNYGKIIDKLLATADVQVSCLTDTPDVILGYSIRRGEILDWVFVKKAWRNYGIGRSLTSEISTCTHLTNVGLSIKKKKNIIYNPFI